MAWINYAISMHWCFRLGVPSSSSHFAMLQLNGIFKFISPSCTNENNYVLVLIYLDAKEYLRLHTLNGIF
jgi:hypothetical protein